MTIILPASKSIIWYMVLFFIVLHISSLYGLYLSFHVKWQTHFFVILLIIISGLGVTAGAHRLWSHAAFRARLPLRIGLAILQTLALQRDIYEWCRDHRVHHKFCETDADPHDARRGFFFSHIGWLMVRKHPEVIKKGSQLDYSDLLDDPVVSFQRKFYIPLAFIIGISLPTLIPVYLWDENLMRAFFVCVVLRYCISLHIAFCINSVAHLFGSRPYDKNINSRDNFSLAMTAMGEGFHNYHHTFPQDYSTSEWGWSFNLTTLFIDVCSYMGLAYDLRKTHPNIVNQRKRRTGET